MENVINLIVTRAVSGKIFQILELASWDGFGLTTYLYKISNKLWITLGKFE